MKYNASIDPKKYTTVLGQNNNHPNCTFVPLFKETKNLRNSKKFSRKKEGKKIVQNYKNWGFLFLG
jgi:hypothetical protein